MDNDKSRSGGWLTFGAGIRPFIEIGIMVGTMLIGAGIIKESYSSLQREVAQLRESSTRDLADIRRLIEIRDERARETEGRVAEHGAMIRALESRMYRDSDGNNRR